MTGYPSLQFVEHLRRLKHLRSAAGIVLGPDLHVKVASFEDMTVVLEQRLSDADGDGSGEAEIERGLREDDIESLRDLASGAPVVRAVNDLLEKAVELRASPAEILRVTMMR
jgi:general secretion pathway protein E